MSCHFK